MPLPMYRLWSDQQLAWLDALGLRVYTRMPSEQPLSRPAATFDGHNWNSDGRSHSELASAAKQGSNQQDFSRALISGQAQSPAVRPFSTTLLPDRLFIALLKACAGDPSRPEIAQLMQECSLDTLRADPRAKRMLWPRLRRLRRQSLCQS